MTTHAVYAVLDTDLGHHKVRVSDHLRWTDAVDLHTALSNGRRVMRPNYSVYGRPVHYLCVRSSDDPAWPADRPVLPLRCACTCANRPAVT